MDFSETIAACDLKVGRCRQLIEIMKVLKVKVISLPYIFQDLYVLCFTRPRYQVSVYRAIGPLVIIISYHCSWMLCRVAAVKHLPALIYSADYILLLVL